MSMPTAEVTASRIREHMRRADVTQVAIAEALGISQPQVSQRMRGDIDWRLTELRTIATLLRVSLSDLVDDPTETSAESA